MTKTGPTHSAAASRKKQMLTPVAGRKAMLAQARDWLAEQKEQLKHEFLASGKPDILLSAHAELIDTLIAALYAHVAGEGEPAVAVIAVGGYGRAELFPYSDLDLLFLHDGNAKEAGRIAEAILYFLWDLGLTVGQAHRSIDDTIELARGDTTIRTNLLDARFLVGKRDYYDQFRQRFDQEIADGNVMEFVEAKLAERDARHRRFGDSRYMLEPNVKEGKGGLRDVHTLWWLARIAYPVQIFSDLVSANVLTKEEYKLFDQARQFLCKVRIYLHYQMERPEERLTFDRQHALAVAMGYTHPSMNRAIERFMRRYFVAVRTVGTTTRIFCALLEDSKKRKPHKSLAWLWYSPWKLGGFKLDGQRLNVKSDQAFINNPLLMLEIFRFSQLHDLDIHPRALQLMVRDLGHIDGALLRDPQANAIFLDILLSDHAPETTLRRMSDAGVLGKFIPDFGRVVGQTQFNMYHVYTVDEHTLVAIGILHAIEKGQMREELTLASDLIRRIEMRRVLYLALFCHDIAKGRGEDHSLAGERLVTKLAVRLGFSPEETETAAWLVRYHLLFSNTAFKRDIDDPKTIQDFVAIVQSSERLKLLLVLTVADIRAVGPMVWNGWKASLLEELYERAEQTIGTGHPALKQQHAGQFKEELAKHLPGWSVGDVAHYIEQGNPAFLAGCDLPRHAVIARMLRQSEKMELPLLMDTQHDYERRITEITICTPDQHGLFSSIAGAMSLSGANIINAKIFTLKNGMAVDIFQVQDTTGDVFDRADRLAKMSVYIEQALSGELNLASLLMRHRRGGNPSRNAVQVKGQVFIENNASNIFSVIELTGHDRSGFLYQVTQAMAELGLSIATAHISTYGTQVADVFYVKDIFGMKISHEAKIKQVRAALLKAINLPAVSG